MSFEDDVTRMKKIFEDNRPLFRPAGESELHHREEAQDEEDRLYKERRIAEIGPVLHKLVSIVPGVKALEHDYLDYPIGNHGEWDDEGFPEKISFNIKVYNINMPDWAREKQDLLNLEARANELISNDMQDQLEMFGEDLQEEYRFIDDWYQAGRMGGWLVIDVDSLSDMYEVRRILDDYNDFNFALDDTDDWALVDFESAIKDVTEYGQILTKRMTDLNDIQKKVERAKKAVADMFSSNEYWEEFFERHEAEVAEEREE